MQRWGRQRAMQGFSLLLLACSTAGAQTQHAHRSLQLAIDNDLIAVRGVGRPPDYDYTHGTRVAVAWPSAPTWVGRLLGKRPDCGHAFTGAGACMTSALEFGQEIYTPRRDAAVPISGERPYAGWLYSSAVASVVAPGYTRFLRLTVGVTGPPALAAEVQNALHRLLRNEPQLGWAHQLPFRPGLAIAFGARHSREQSLGHTGAARLGMGWGATLGTVRTALHVGADARVGSRADLPWSPTDPELDRPMRLYLLGSVRAERVFQNALVEGYTDAQNPGAESRPFVTQCELGLGARWRAFGIEYRHVVRGREYVAQPNAHAYGSLVLTLHQF